MPTYLKEVLDTPTPQSEPLPGVEMVKNSAGGYVFEIDDFARLERFLVLGSEGGTYYTNQRKLTLENTETVRKALKADGPRTVATIAEMSHQGRIPRNSTALFCLALAAAEGDSETQNAALAALPKVARTGSHLLEFVSYADSLRGWGRRLRRGVGEWYDRDPRRLAYQVLKYRNRSNWTHRDVLRKTHPPEGATHHDIFAYITQGILPPETEDYAQVHAYEKAQKADTADLVSLIKEHDLSREMIPTEKLQEKEVWAALAEDMPITALFRNLATLTRVGVIAPFADAVPGIVAKLTDEEALKRGRVHPIQAMSALITYASGKSPRGTGTWEPVQQIVDALDTAFEKSFSTVEPTGKRLYLGVDVSASMMWHTIAGVPGLTPRNGAAALALVTARTEPNYHIRGFCHQMVDLGLTARDSFKDAVEKTSRADFGRTDCSLPMIDALQRKMPVDCFVVITDNETWSGNIHVETALDQYRTEMGIPAKLVVIGMTSTQFSIADPDDPYQMDVVGFDTSVPDIMASFIRS